MFLLKAGKVIMSKLFEIFGKAITVNTSDLIWHWLNAVTVRDQSKVDVRQSDFEEIIDLLGKNELDQAEEKLKFYLFEEPECTNGRMVAVAICLKRNLPEEAIEHLQSIYCRQPSINVKWQPHRACRLYVSATC